MPHVSVLYQEVMGLLQPQPGSRYIDGTLGGGGHTQGLLEASGPDGRVLALDRDAAALAQTQARLTHLGDRLLCVQASFAALASVAPAYGFDQVDGVLLDLGLSSDQLDAADRGFSFRFEAPLDMRFDRSGGVTAADLVNDLPEAELADVLWGYGEVTNSRQLARWLAANRPIHTTTQLADLVAQRANRRRQTRIHPATQVFQALRIAVNQELEALAAGLAATLPLLKPGGRLAVISFHSLEDRLVKRFLHTASRDCICPPPQPVCTCGHRATVRLVTRKAVQPGEAEIARNPRSRSARLRVAEKLPS